MANPLIAKAQNAVNFRSEFIAGKLQEHEIHNPIFKPAATLFKNAYQNPIQTTAVILPKVPIRTYAGTGGWKCWGPPKSPVPLCKDSYPKEWKETGFDQGLLSAMWVRDACAQYYSYVGMFKASEGKPPVDQLGALGSIIEGIIRLSADFLTHHYGPPKHNEPLGIQAHAFNCDGCNDSFAYSIYNLNSTGQPDPHYEPDTLAYLVFLASEFDKYVSPSTKRLDEYFWNAMEATIKILKDNLLYFQNGKRVSTPTDCALTRTPYRPSDDPIETGYVNIPVNAFLSVAMEKLSVLASKYHRFIVAPDALSLSRKLAKGVMTHGIGVVDEPGVDGSSIFAYEINYHTPGENQHLYDDAAIPSLLSLPYLGFGPADSKIYQATRAFVLSPTTNKYYYVGEDKGHQFDGIGGEHTNNVNGGTARSIWPMAIIMRGMTADAAHKPAQERLSALKMLVDSSQVEFQSPPPNHKQPGFYGPASQADWNKFSPTNYIHESFFADNPNNFTRGWFAWVNALFGEWIDTMVRERTLPTV